MLKGKEDHMTEKLMTVREVSEKLGINLNAVYRLFNTGKLDGCLMGKKSIRFTQEQVRAYIEKVSTSTASEG